MGKSSLTIELPPELKDSLVRLAEDMGRPLDQVVGRALAAYVAYERPIVDGIVRAQEDVRAGRTVPHEEAMRRIYATIERAKKRRAAE